MTPDTEIRCLFFEDTKYRERGETVVVFFHDTGYRDKVLFIEDTGYREAGGILS